MMYVKQTKAQVVAHLKNNESWYGILVPSNHTPHDKKHYSFPNRLHLTKWSDGIRSNSGYCHLFDNLIAEFKEFNCNEKDGKSVHYYMEVEILNTMPTR